MGPRHLGAPPFIGRLAVSIKQQFSLCYFFDDPQVTSSFRLTLESRQILENERKRFFFGTARWAGSQMALKASSTAG